MKAILKEIYTEEAFKSSPPLCAFLQDWPYGSHRCIRAVWVECKRNKGMRFACATTHKSENKEYMDLRGFHPTKVAVRKKKEIFLQCKGNGTFGGVWNKTKYSKYQELVIVTHEEPEDQRPNTEVHSCHEFDPIELKENFVSSFTSYENYTEILKEIIPRHLHPVYFGEKDAGILG